MSSSNTFSTNETDRMLEIVFCATMDNVDHACRVALVFLENHVAGVRPHLFAIHLGIREGLTNAVRHGNKNDATKQVTCTIFTNRNHCLEIDIEDQGTGFDWKKQGVPIPDDTSEHGRGLSIIEQYFTSFRFNDRGNRLTLSMDQPFNT